MKKSWLALLAPYLLLIAVYGLMAPDTGQVSHETSAQIRLGMTKAEVDDILGAEHICYVAPGSCSGPSSLGVHVHYAADALCAHEFVLETTFVNGRLTQFRLVDLRGTFATACHDGIGRMAHWVRQETCEPLRSRARNWLRESVRKHLGL